MHRLAASKRQRGQAMVFTLVFAAITGLAVLLLFNSSKLANAKTNLQNAADAGAHAAATLQARDHNFSAYTNRAMIANQVAVGQFVSLNSYYEDAKKTQKRMDDWLLDLYAMFPSSKPAWDAAKKIPVSSTESALSNLAPQAVKGLDALISALEQAQNIHHTATAVEMMAVADDVVKKSDPAASVTTSAFMLGDAALRVTNWSNYIKQHPANTSAPEADRFADAVLHDDSQDNFSRNRFGGLSPLWAGSVRFTMCPLAASTFTMFAFVHGGGTLLSEDKKHWFAMDATLGGGFATCTWIYPCVTGLCSTTVTIPFLDITNEGMGSSGGSLAGRNSGYDSLFGYKGNDWTSALYGDAMIASPVSAGLRYYSSGPGQTLDSDGGLQNYYRDVANPLGSKPADQTPEQNGGAYHVTVEVERKVDASLRLSSTLLPDAADVRLHDAAKGSTMRAIASGHAYFYRPKQDSSSEFTRNGWKRADNRTEMANLFNPYWQARLADTPMAESVASAAAQN